MIACSILLTGRYRMGESEVGRCPRCGIQGFVLDYEEVDIEVGVQRRLIGGLCPSCGGLLVNHCCGAWDFQPHATWCRDQPAKPGLDWAKFSEVSMVRWRPHGDHHHRCEVHGIVFADTEPCIKCQKEFGGS